MRPLARGDVQVEGHQVRLGHDVREPVPVVGVEEVCVRWHVQRLPHLCPRRPQRQRFVCPARIVVQPAAYSGPSLASSRLVAGFCRALGQPPARVARLSAVSLESKGVVVRAVVVQRVFCGPRTSVSQQATRHDEESLP
eukprot:3267209-Rhodomonas_salina.4